MTCHDCGQAGHMVRECPNQVCYGCGEKVHVARNCPAAAVKGKGKGKSKGKGKNVYEATPWWEEWTYPVEGGGMSLGGAIGQAAYNWPEEAVKGAY